MRRRLRWLLPAAVVPVVGLLAFGLTRDATVLPSALVGKEAPAFHLETVEGDTVRLDDLRGKVVVLNFWASWCIPCRTEHSVLLRASRAWPAENVAVVGIVYQDSRPNARRFMEALGGDWPSGLDPASRTAIDYGVYGVPETYFLSADGRVARKQVGPVTWELVRATVDSLLAARDPVSGVREAEDAPADPAGPTGTGETTR